jgi:nitroreductase
MRGEKMEEKYSEEKIYQSIFRRKSIRKFKDELLEQKQLNKIRDFLESRAGLYADIKVENKIVSKEEIISLLPIKAPHYLLFFSEEEEGYLNNAGFILQHLDLYLSAEGFGSCWFGLAKAKKEIAEQSDLSYVITLAFGKAEEKLHRENISEFDRKTIKEIRDKALHDELIEAARLAPSATNNQPWYFKVNENRIDVYLEKANFLKKIFYKKMNQIDIGIAAAHLKLAADHFNKNNKFIFNSADAEELADYIYQFSLKIQV